MEIKTKSMIFNVKIELNTHVSVGQGKKSVQNTCNCTYIMIIEIIKIVYIDI